MRFWKKARTEPWGHMKGVERLSPTCSSGCRPSSVPTFSGSRSFSADWAESLFEKCLCPKELPDPRLQPFLQYSSQPTSLIDWGGIKKALAPCFSSEQPWGVILALSSLWIRLWHRLKPYCSCSTSYSTQPAALIPYSQCFPKCSPGNSCTEISVSKCFPGNPTSDNSMPMTNGVYL